MAFNINDEDDIKLNESIDQERREHITLSPQSSVRGKKGFFGL